MAIHLLELSESSLHDHYAARLTPALVIDSGDTVCLKTLDVGWGLGLPADRYSRLPSHPRPETAQRGGPALSGPIVVRGARVGQVLEVRIDEIVPGSWGWTRAGGRDIALDRSLGVAGEERQLFAWSIDPVAGIARSQLGYAIPLRPFLGMMGVCPPGEDVHDAWLPTRWGGNLDCRALTAGATLYLPVGVDGALFSAGDGHGAQGDGELCGQALECPMESVRLTFALHDSLPLSRLRARTPEGWITFGFATSLDDALMEAANDMLDLIGDVFSCHERSDALALASCVVDFRVTQVANPLFGVHAVLPHDTIQKRLL